MAARKVEYFQLNGASTRSWVRLAHKWIGYGVFHSFCYSICLRETERPQIIIDCSKRKKRATIATTKLPRIPPYSPERLSYRLSPRMNGEQKRRLRRRRPLDVSVWLLFYPAKVTRIAIRRMRITFTSKVVSRLVIVDLPGKRPATAIPKFPACVLSQATRHHCCCESQTQ